MDSPNSGDHLDDGPGPTDEFEVIDRLRVRFEAGARAIHPDQALPPAGDTWIGDDAAVVSIGPGNGAGTDVLGVWTADLVVEGTHFDLDICSLEDVGFKALMVAVSDLAAMGAWPRGALVSIAAPSGTDIDLLGEGLATAAELAECVVVGGDLSQAPTLVVSVAALGTLRGETIGGPLLRSGARPGDHLLVTGPLGGSAAGLRLLRGGGVGGGQEQAGPWVDGLVRAYRRPMARIREGETARLAGATAAIDISDGLIADLRHLGRSSDVGVELDSLPVADGASDPEALGGGEEYELLVATPHPDRLVEAFRSAGLASPVVIGSCTGHPGRYTRAGLPLPRGGWRHTF